MKRYLLLSLLSLIYGLTAFAQVEIDGIYYNLNDDNKTAEVTGNDWRGGTYSGSVSIPESITYDNITFDVTSIGEFAFFSCSSLTSITIPNSVTSIGIGAFDGCSGLTSITIPNSMTSIGVYVFSGCSSLESITVASDNERYDSRDNCNAIIEKSSNTLIAGCKNTIIPNSVTSIGGTAFSCCSGLTSITIPNSVTSIGGDAFEYCSGLTSITIPNSVTSIEGWVFEKCTGLTSVSIGNSVTSIGGGAFSDCLAIEKVLCYAETVPRLGADVFDFNAIESATLYVPASALEDYKNSYPWNCFGTILPMTEEQTPVKSVLDGDRIDASAPVFNMRGQRVDKNARGLLIVGGKKVIR